MYREGLSHYIRTFRNPYDISFNEQKKIIYMRTPKTASSSIATALNKSGLRLFRKKEYRKKYIEWLGRLTDEKLEEYYIFSSIRNPWDRVVSVLAYSHSSMNLNSLTSSSSKLQKIVSTRHGIPQHLFTHLNGHQFVDDIIRVESIEEDFKRIAQHLKVEPKLKHLNKSEHRPYKSYYINHSVQLIGTIYEKDISLFRYNYNGEVND